MITYPLTYSQLGILMSCRREPGSTAFQLPSAIPFSKAMDGHRLAEALGRVIGCRSVLRTRLVLTEDNEPRQFSDSGMPLEVPCRQTTEAEALAYIEHGFVRPFMLFGPQPLCRFEILMTEAHTWLLTDIHHIISDGMTIAHLLMGRDLPAAFRGKALDADNTSLYELAEAEQRAMGSGEYMAAKTYYQYLFQDVSFSVLPLAGKSAYGHAPTSDQRMPRRDIDHWCSARQVAPNLLFMAAFCVVLSKLSHHPTVAFATLSHGRSNRPLRQAYGMFVKTVPFVADVAPDATVPDLVAQLRRRLVSSVRHASYPYVHFCRDQHQTAGLTFAFQGSDIMEQVSVGGETVVGRQLIKNHADDGLSCVVYTHADDYELRMEGGDAPHGEFTAQLFARCMCRCLRYVIGHEEATVAEVELVDEHEKAEILTRSQGEITAADDDTTLVGLFDRRARLSPDAVAVSDGSESMTYAQLQRRSCALACWLKERGVGKGDFVGIETVACCAFLASALAVMRVGAAYVPVDVTWPLAYRQSVLSEFSPKVVVDPRRLPSPLVCEPPLFDHSSPSGLAYMIYTSGTTGRAKGVMIPHRALSSLSHSIVRHWRLDAQSRISCHSSLAFDASVEDLYPVLTVGGTVYVMPEPVRRDVRKIHQWIDQYQITGGCYTTQLGQMLAGHPHPSLRYICLGGERMTVTPRAAYRVINTYGPTEFCVDATYYELEPGRVYEEIPIGRPLDNMAAYVTDLHGRLLPWGAVGELCLSGVQMAAGYWRAPDLTARNFRPCAFAGAQVYHTGDLARWNSKGQLEYVGRIDHLVKVNGYRVNLEEVERQVCRLPHVTSACVTAPTRGGHPLFCAYFTADSAVDGQTLSRQMQEMVPSYMLPAEWVRMERMPLLENGKVDRRRLPLPGKRPVEPPAKALSEREQLVCDVFGRVLQVADVRMDDDFFALGGTSLAVMSLIDELEKAGIHIGYGSVFKNSTPRLLLRYVETGGELRWPIDGDYHSIGRFLARVTPVEASGAHQPFGGCTLLTGSTGFLGMHVLRELIGQGRGHVYCLVRASSDEAALRRLGDRFRFYFGRLPDRDELSRIRVVAGDLTDENCLHALSGVPIVRVVNCAANVRHYARANELAAVNTDAVERLARFCQASHARFVHISTLGVAGLSPAAQAQDVCLTERDFYIGQQLGDEYTFSKFKAERFLLGQMAAGQLDAVVMRVGNLSPRSYDGQFQYEPQQNGLAMTLRLFNHLGMMPARAATIAVDLSPVDIVARSVVCLADLRQGMPVWHVAHPSRFSLRELLAMKGCRVRVVDDREFQEQLEKAKTEEAMRRMALPAVGYLAMPGQLRPNRYDSRLTTEVLGSLGVVWPDPGLSCSALSVPGF